MIEMKHLQLAGSIRCNELVENATELVAYNLEIEAKGKFKLTNNDIKKILEALTVTVLKAAIGCD
ncbi:MAG: hypothetical protein K0S76_759 [Herbinix sp.]|jgi:hypothetical protein|nr:hypothetical protein [Herbinix sp.]